jgi:hypothetical protein
MSIGRSLFIAFTIILCGVTSAWSQTNKVSSLEWLDNDIGKDKIVLPGFTPITVSNKTVKLGAGREYIWDDSYLPVFISSRGRPLAKDMELVVRIDGNDILIVPQSIEIENHGGHDVVVIAKGIIESFGEITVNSHVEYDGFVRVELSLHPVNQKVNIESIYYRSVVNTLPSTKLAAYKLANIRQWGRPSVFDTSYSGDFLSTIGIVDGDTGFWWFVDREPLAGQSQLLRTKLSPNENELAIQQPLLISGSGNKLALSSVFNFMATPIKADNGAWREERILGSLAAPELKHGKYHLWWINAFAHQSFPYTKIPRSLRNTLPANDLKVYKGLNNTRAELKKFKAKGIERIPYFSAHTLPAFDPALAEFRKHWEVKPDFIIPFSDKPFQSKADRPWLSYQSEGYVDYLIYRFDKLIDKTGINGLYFDQANVIDSINKSHSGDVYGQKIVSDIAGSRKFYKRLATLFHTKGIEGYIVAHNSNTPIMPAYSFVSAMVQGEEFTKLLKNYDYVGSQGLDTIRTNYAERHFGVPTIWLSQLWAPDSRLASSSRQKITSQQEWLGTDQYAGAFRGLMSLSLLHDVLVWSLSPLPMRTIIYEQLDDFGVGAASFHGYWNSTLRAVGSSSRISYYLNEKEDEALLVVANFDVTGSSVTVAGFLTEFPQSFVISAVDATGVSVIEKINSNAWRFGVKSKDFVLVRIKFSKGES